MKTVSIQLVLLLLLGTVPTAVQAQNYPLATGGTLADEGRSVAVDATGNTFVAGIFRGTVDFDPGPATASLTAASADGFLASYDNTGAFRFVVPLGGSGDGDAAFGVALDASGNAYVVGAFRGTVDFDPGAGTASFTAQGGLDGFLASYTNTGAYRYAVPIGSAGASNDDQALGVAVDGAGNAYVAGAFAGTVDFDPGAGTASRTAAGFLDGFLASYDASGAYRYAVRLGGASNDIAYAVAVDATGNTQVGGIFGATVDFDPGAGTASRTASGSYDAYLASYTNTGAFRYVSRVGGANEEAFLGVAVDASGNAYVTGTFTGTADFDPGSGSATLTATAADAFVASYDATTGAYRFVVPIGGADAQQGRDVAVDGAGNVYATGLFAGTVDFNPDAVAVDSRTSAGDNDVFLASYESDGDFRYASTAGGAGTDIGYGVATDAAQYAYVTGAFNGTADFDPGAGAFNRTSNGDRDAFLSAYDLAGNLATAGLLPVELTLFTATLDGDAAVLQWHTASETNNAGFSVEHRQGAGAWAEIGFREGGGTRVEAQDYAFRTLPLAPGVHAFRLRQVDFDGAFSYGPEVELTVEGEGAFTFSAPWPNPARDAASVLLRVARQQHVRVSVYSLDGREMARPFDGVATADGATVRVDVAALPAGVYLLRAAGETFAAHQQLVVVR